MPPCHPPAWRIARGGFALLELLALWGRLVFRRRLAFWEWLIQR